MYVRFRAFSAGLRLTALAGRLVIMRTTYGTWEKKR